MKPETLGILRDEALAGVGASTLMRSLAPVLDRQIEAITLKLEGAVPELNVLLDLRAQLKVLRQLRRELEVTINVGRDANEALNPEYK